MSYGFESNSLVVKKEGLDLEKFKEDVRNMCCSDYSGESGEDYFTDVEKDGVTVNISVFDFYWDKFTDQGMSLSDVTREVLKNNYESDREYFVDYNLNVLDREDEIIIFTSAMTYC